MKIGRDTTTARLRRISVIGLCVVVSLLISGCHDEAKLRSRLEGPTPRLPVEPDQPATPPAPALLDIVRAWRQPDQFKGNAMDAWAIVSAHANDDDDITFRVPQSWTIKNSGRATNATAVVDAHARVTKLRDSDISLATYAAQLAEGNPIFQYVTSDGHIVYVTRREVALAPSDPTAAREIFHTAVLSVDGKIAKLDVRFDRSLEWRFDDLADAIAGTIQVRPRSLQEGEL